MTVFYEDLDWFKAVCAAENISPSAHQKEWLLERVAIKVDSGINVDEAREQAFSEVFA